MMISHSGWRARFLAALAAATILSTAATAGPIADKAADAEAALAAGDAGKAFAAMNEAVEALWAEAPLTIGAAFLVAAGDTPQPRGDADFRSGEALRIQVEPLGYSFGESAGDFAVGLATSVEIRTPGGLILAKSEDLGRLEWRGPLPNRSFSGRVGIDLPELKPGEYEVRLTLSDAGKDQTATTTLPFTIVAGE